MKAYIQFQDALTIFQFFFGGGDPPDFSWAGLFKSDFFLKKKAFLLKKSEPTSSVRFSCLLAEVLDTYADGTYAGTLRLSEVYYD